MTETQKLFTAFIESICKKIGCTDATEALQKGFAVFCEAYDPYEDAARRRAISQLRNNIKVTSSTGEVRPNNVTAVAPDRRTKVIGYKTRDEIAQEVDAAHPEFRDSKGNMSGFDAVKNRDNLIAQRMTEQFEKNNENMARRNAAAIAKLPFDTVKQMFPNAYLKIQGEVWVRKFLKKEKDAVTGKVNVTGAVGSWEKAIDSDEYDDVTTAITAAKRKYSPGHWKLYTIIPELQAQVTNVIPSDA